MEYTEHTTTEDENLSPELLEANRLAESFLSSSTFDLQPSTEDLDRWSRLFGYTALEAQHLLVEHRTSLGVLHVSDEHWDLVRAEREAVGYDREAYEHLLGLESVLEMHSAYVSNGGVGEDGEEEGVGEGRGGGVFMFRLGGLLESVEKVMEITGLEHRPKVIMAQGENGQTELCAVDGNAKKRIEEWLKYKSVLIKDDGK